MKYGMCEAVMLLEPWCWFNPSLAPSSPCSAGLPPLWFSNIHLQKGLRLSWTYLKPGQINVGLPKARDPTPTPLPWQDPGVSYSRPVKAALHKPQRGLGERQVRHVPGDARAGKRALG